MKKQIFVLRVLVISILVLFFSEFVKAQTPDEALRYSRLNYTFSTARSAGMAGSFGALGGDFSVLSTNPAGLGVYRTADCSFTPSVTYGKTSSNYMANTFKDDKTKFNIGQFGFVIPYEARDNAKELGFNYFQLAIGVNRHNNFSNRMKFSAINPLNSITSSWVDQINAANPDIFIPETGDISLNNLDPFSSELAWNTYLIDWAIDDEGKAFVFSDMEGGNVQQDVMMSTYGTMNEFVVSGALNWKDKLYFGTTIGVPYFHYYELFRIKETDPNNINDFFNEMNYITELKTSGSGINLKTGLLYQATKRLRLGLAVHTPTKFNLDDHYYAEMTTNLCLNDSIGNEQFKEAKESYFSYTLRTPMRLMANIGYVIGKRGAINIDYMYQDYSNAKFRHSDFSFDEANAMINDNYGQTHRLSVGTEWVLGLMMVRAGYGIETSPYSNNDREAIRQQISAGLGMRFSSLYLDFAYVYNSESNSFYAYDSNYAPVAVNYYTIQQFMLTIGFKL